ncbi:MAG: hypothetical protein NT169_18235 [Chloroflexi bacterium]|nr:hypothetical protein [Chloroflexota bacterium]
MEFDQTIRDGVLWPIWAPDHVLGFGYPLWLVYAPLAYIVAELFHLIGWGFVAAVKLTWALGFLVGAAGMYRLARRWWGPAAGLIASLAYTYAPYHLVDIYVRAALAEFTALAVFPWALLALVALWDDPRPRRAAWASLALGALLLSHSVALVTFVPLLGGFLLLQLTSSWLGRRATDDDRPRSLVVGRRSSVVGLRSTVWTGIALLLGGLLAAIFLLPFLLERRYIVEASWLSGTYDFRLHFVYLSQFFSSFWGFGYSVEGPGDGMSFQLGLLQVIGAVVGVVGAFAKRNTQYAIRNTHHASRNTQHATRITHHASRITHHASRITQSPISNLQYLVPFLVAATLFCLFAMTSAAQPIWEALPLVGSIQFPWRLLGLTTVTLALLCGAAVHWLEDDPTRAGVEPSGEPTSAGTSTPKRGSAPSPYVYVAALAFVLASFAYTRPELVPIRPQDESPLAVIEFETEHPDMRGMTLWAERVPVDADSPLLAQYLAGQPVTKAAVATGQGSILEQDHTATSAHVRVRAETEVRLRFYTYYFPGWQATVDGRPVEIAADPPNGLIGLTLPSGEHDVRLRFGPTPVRRVAAGLSLLALGGILVLWFVGRRPVQIAFQA